MNDLLKTPQASRREFLKRTGLTAAALASSAAAEASGSPASAAPAGKRPNVLMICADQFRADFVGAAGENPSSITPHIDKLAARGTMFRKAVCNQPLCSPSRSSFLTSRYATETGVWKLELEPDHAIPTLANAFNQAGYSSHFIGKWHVSAGEIPGKPGLNSGWIAPGPSRGGFDALWEGANMIELVSHPYYGNYWDNAGANIGFKDAYRVDFITGRAVSFIEQPHTQPWFLFLSQLEPHHQNDVDQFVAPDRYKDSYTDPFVPIDLRNLPGNWQSHLPGYYGCCQAIDDCIGSVVASLEKTGQLDNTVILFFSDHGCTFRTRMGEYKRSPHESSIRVPFVVAGPGFDHGIIRDELISLLDLAPTLLDAAGIAPEPDMRGHSVLPMLRRHAPDSNAAHATPSTPWDSTAFIQISASMCARTLRTPEWTYVVWDPTVNGNEVSHSTRYTECALYNLPGDPAQLTNLIGRPRYRPIAAQLREEMKRRILAAGEPPADIAATELFL